MKAEIIIRLLTISSLAGLLLGVGLRLTVGEVMFSLRKCRLLLLVVLNFMVVPALVVVATRTLGFEVHLAMGMILLAAAPFAPVVPVFARMARADLALAAGLSSIFPLISAFLTPFVFQAALMGVSEARSLRFDTLGVLVTLLATIILPLGVGMALKHFTPILGRRALQPVEIVAEATGALSLAFVAYTEGSAILATGWLPLIVMAVLCECSLLLGYAAGGPERAARQVVAFGTGNRNIALALLVAVESFPGTVVMSTVVTNGLVMIFVGLLHVGFWRWRGAGTMAELNPHQAS